MVFWEKKKKKPRDDFGLFGQFPFDDDFEGKFADEMKAMENMLKSLMNPEVIRKMQSGSNKPIISGFSLKMGPNGKMDFEQFGNVQPKGQKPVLKGEREPLVDVINRPKEVTVIAELPGVDKREIMLKVQGKGETLSIHVPNKFSKKVELPAKVKSKMTKANYKNGVLEVNLVKEKAGKDSGHSIPVE
jgi:HSP20 family protein